MNVQNNKVNFTVVPPYPSLPSTKILTTTTTLQAVRRGHGAQLPCFGLSPLLLMKKCYFMHKMCQIPHPHRRLRPMSHLLDLATLTTACKKGKLRINVQSEYQV